MSARQAAMRERPARKRTHRAALTIVENEHTHTPPRWTCSHHINGSDITAYVAATNGLEIIAQTRWIEGVDPKANAEYLVRAVNAYETSRPLIADLVNALELCMKCELSWEAEQEADVVCAKAKRVVGQ